MKLRNTVALMNILIVIGFIVALSCSSDSGTKPLPPVNTFGYTFTAPDTIVYLPEILNEISDLTMYANNRLAAVQDEKGHLYFIDIDSFTITDKDFGKNGDFEGLSQAGIPIYVLKSNGDMYYIENPDADKLDGVKIATGLVAENNTEGLAFDSLNNRLLIACKDAPGAGLTHHRAVYAFDLTTQTLVEQPVIAMDINQNLEDFINFRPSALGFHPVTGDLYILSAFNRSVLILNKKLEITYYYILPQNLYERPEGIAFLPNGDMFISNEKGNMPQATLLRLNYIIVD